MGTAGRFFGEDGEKEGGFQTRPAAPLDTGPVSGYGAGFSPVTVQY